MTDLNRLADLILPGIRNAQLKLEEVSNYLGVMPNSLRQYNGWQPIETAPKDGLTDILMFQNGGIYMATWSRLGPLPNTNFGWVSNTGYQLEPTHWMLLPEPPK